MRPKRPKNNRKKLLIAGLVLVLVLVVTGVVVAQNNDNGLFGSSDDTSDEANTTSDADTAQSDYSDGDDRDIPENDDNEGSVVDNQGNVTDTPDEESWSVSSTGEITVYTPSANSKLLSGSKFTGSSSLSNVNFRLIDDVSGVIAQGQVSVVNGKFSGTFNFSTTASEGRLDIFGMKGDGIEYSNVEIPVRFK